MIETIVTMKFYTSKEELEGKEMQEFLNSIKSGEAQREFTKDTKIKVKISYTSCPTIIGGTGSGGNITVEDLKC